MSLFFSASPYVPYFFSTFFSRIPAFNYFLQIFHVVLGDMQESHCFKGLGINTYSHRDFVKIVKRWK